jgi:hypothetical protein
MNHIDLIAWLSPSESVAREEAWMKREVVAHPYFRLAALDQKIATK